MKTLNEKVGSRIKEAREAAGFTQTDVAGLLGVSKNAVSKWETGENSVSIKVLFNLTSILHRSVEYFLDLNTELSEPEMRLLEVYRAMPERDRRYWLGVLEGWLRELEDDDLE